MSINFKQIDATQFLTEFWQKKPLLIRDALPGFTNILSPDELAGLSMEKEIESRMVVSTPNQPPFWHLKKGPFLENDFQKLPPTHWTLLVQGVDCVIPELAFLFDHFNFIPQWRVDDLMISYASEHGSVGPHYDHYDVFLYQAKGSRKWSLTTQDCHEGNVVPDVPLRIMKDFKIEEEYILEEGDMLYLPPHVGHYGTAISKDCMTYSFGYRSYSARELWDSYGDYCAESNASSAYYRDPNWSTLKHTSELPYASFTQAKDTLQKLLNNEPLLKSWFGCFATQLDPQAESFLPEPVSESMESFINELSSSNGLMRHPSVRFAYHAQTATQPITLFINGCEWNTTGVADELIQQIANQRVLPIDQLRPWLHHPESRQFLFDLWTLQWLYTMEE